MVTRVASPDEVAAASDVRDGVVFIHVLSSVVADGNRAGIARIGNEYGEALKNIVADNISKQLTTVPRRQLARMRTNPLTAAFVPVKPVDVSDGQVVRIATKMTIIQVLDEGILAKLDGVMCRIETLGGDNAEFAAKIGSRIVRDIPIDSVFLVAKARSYPTVGGTEGHYIPLYPVSSLLSDDGFRDLVDNEIQKRSGGGSNVTDSDTSDAKALDRYLQRLRHTFVDDSGKFSADAAVVEVTEEQVRLLTIDKNKELTVPLSRLSERDRGWLRDNATWIKAYGKKYEQLLLDDKGN
jgi:hypothetical protein